MTSDAVAVLAGMQADQGSYFDPQRAHGARIGQPGTLTVGGASPSTSADARGRGEGRARCEPASGASNACASVVERP